MEKAKAVLFIICNAKRDDNSRVAKSIATANENEPKCSSHRCRNEGKELLTFLRPQVGRNLQQEMPSSPLPTLKWGLGRGGSWLYFFQTLHCMHLSSPGLALTSHQVLNHCFRLWLSIATTETKKEIPRVPHLLSDDAFKHHDPYGNRSKNWISIQSCQGKSRQ